MGTSYWDETSIAWLLSKAPGRHHSAVAIAMPLRLCWLCWDWGDLHMLTHYNRHKVRRVATCRKTWKTISRNGSIAWTRPQRRNHPGLRRWPPLRRCSRNSLYGQAFQTLPNGADVAVYD